MRKILITAILSMTVIAPAYGVDSPLEKEKATMPATTNQPSNELLPEKDGVKGPSEKMLPVIKKPWREIGEVIAVDVSANTIKVKNRSGATTITVDNTTKFRPEGKTISDIKVGDNVDVKYYEDGKNTATSIVWRKARKKPE